MLILQQGQQEGGNNQDPQDHRPDKHMQSLLRGLTLLISSGLRALLVTGKPFPLVGPGAITCDKIIARPATRLQQGGVGRIGITTGHSWRRHY